MRLCCPSVSEFGIDTVGEYKCEDKKTIFDGAESGPFYTPFFEGFDYTQNRRNILLDDANFRFDICQGFAALMFDDSFKVNSFVFTESNFTESDPSNYEIKDGKIRYCCSASSHPEDQLDEIIDNYASKIDESVIFKNKKQEQKFKRKTKKGLENKKRKMKKEFANKENDCVYQDLTELK